MNPDERTIVTGAVDEKLRLWSLIYRGMKTNRNFGVLKIFV